MAKRKRKLGDPVDLRPDPSDLRPGPHPGTAIGGYPDPETKVALELAIAFAREENPDYVVVSWACQERAQNYVNEHGFVAALDRLFELEA
jgi:hypothetical protein